MNDHYLYFLILLPIRMSHTVTVYGYTL